MSIPNDRIASWVFVLGFIVVFFAAAALQAPFFFFVILCIIANVGSFLWGLKQPVYHTLPVFEIELSRPKGLVSIIDSEHPDQNPITYSLGIFRGFDVRETAVQLRSKTLFQAELRLKTEPVKGLVRDIPIRRGRYIVSTHNTANIIKATNKWLEQTSGGANAQILKKPKKTGREKEERIVRDFRDME